MNEVWKKIFDDRYEVSDLARVRNAMTLKVLKPQSNRVCLFREGGSRNKPGTYEDRLVAELVLEAFVGECPEHHSVRYKDGDSNNYVLSNLEYASHYIEGERWLPIPDFEGQYEGSDFGRVKSLERVERHSGSGTGTFCVRERILKPLVYSSGYHRVKLYYGNNDSDLFPIHQLVLDLFVGPRPDGRVVNHKNGDKTDNRLVNLEYVTQSDNNRHAARTGLRTYTRGDKHHNTKITDEQALNELFPMIIQGVSYHKAAKYFKVSKPAITQICDGTNRKDLDRPPELIAEVARRKAKAAAGKSKKGVAA